eukprot:scaffold6204_cov56-Phaeocystis_antarctica.AAC.6
MKPGGRSKGSGIGEVGLASDRHRSLSSASTRRGLSSRAQRVALSKRAGLWSGGQSRGPLRARPFRPKYHTSLWAVGRRGCAAGPKRPTLYSGAHRAGPPCAARGRLGPCAAGRLCRCQDDESEQAAVPAVVVEELGVALLVLAVGVEHVLHQHAEAWRRDGARVHPHHAGHAAHAHHPSHAPHAAERREPHAAAHHRRGHGRRVLHELHDELLAGELEAVDRLLRVLGVRGVDVRDVGDAEARLRRGVLHERHLGELAKGREDLAHVRLGDVRVQLRDHELGRLGRRTHAHHLVGRLRVLGRLRQPVLLRHARLHEQRLALEGDAVERESLHDRLGVAELDVPHALGLARALVADQPDVAHAAGLPGEEARRA